MKVLIASPYSRIIALIRFFFLKIFFLNKLEIKNVSYIGRNLKMFIPGNSKIIVNGKIYISDNVELQSRGKISFGNACAINSYSRIVAFSEIKIGDRVRIAQHVSILDHDHKYDIQNGGLNTNGFIIKPITIGNNVWLADKVTITKGVTIGDNVIIAANSVVTKDIPSNTLAGGIPARIIKKLS
jgi:acetyltransferase-like isoleucine patch superfamily enzyme